MQCYRLLVTFNYASNHFFIAACPLIPFHPRFSYLAVEQKCAKTVGGERADHAIHIHGDGSSGIATIFLLPLDTDSI